MVSLNCKFTTVKAIRLKMDSHHSRYQFATLISPSTFNNVKQTPQNSIAKTPQISHADSCNLIHVPIQAPMYAICLLGLVIIVISHIHSSFFPFVLIVNQHRPSPTQSALSFIHRAASCSFAI